MSDLPRRGVCLVLAAPSGAGKSTIAKALREREPGLVNSISVTTRAPRPGERDGVDYFFCSQAEFDRMVADGALLEYAHVFGRSYGTPRAPVERALAAGQDMIFDIDWQGFRQLRASLPGDVVGVFILPPSLAALRERLEARATDSAATIDARMEAAAAEISHWAEFDNLLINQDLAATIDLAHAVLVSARTAVSRQTGLAGQGLNFWTTR